MKGGALHARSANANQKVGTGGWEVGEGFKLMLNRTICLILQKYSIMDFVLKLEKWGEIQYYSSALTVDTHAIGFSSPFNLISYIVCNSQTLVYFVPYDY